jgi:hypothetical protein
MQLLLVPKLLPMLTPTMVAKMTPTMFASLTHLPIPPMSEVEEPLDYPEG